MRGGDENASRLLYEWHQGALFRFVLFMNGASAAQPGVGAGPGAQARTVLKMAAIPEAVATAAAAPSRVATAVSSAATFSFE